MIQNLSRGGLLAAILLSVAVLSVPGVAGAGEILFNMTCEGGGSATDFGWTRGSFTTEFAREGSYSFDGVGANMGSLDISGNNSDDMLIEFWAYNNNTDRDGYAAIGPGESSTEACDSGAGKAVGVGVRDVNDPYWPIWNGLGGIINSDTVRVGSGKGWVKMQFKVVGGSTGRVEIFINDTLEENISLSGAGITSFDYMARTRNINYFIDDLVIYNVTKIPPSTTPSVTITAPPNGTHSREETFTINFTVANFGNYTWCYARYATDTASGGCGAYNVTDGDHSRLCGLASNDDEYTIYVECSGVRSQNITYIRDTVMPDLTWYWPQRPGVSNMTTTTQQVNVSAYDLYLNDKAVNISCGGITYYYNYTENLNVTTDYTDTLLNLTGAAEGSCEMNATYSDDHTATDWSPERLTKNVGDGLLEVKATATTAQITLKSITDLEGAAYSTSSITTEEKDDRVTFKYQIRGKKAATTYTYTYTVSNPGGKVYYRGMDRFGPHFVTSDGNPYTQDQWVDFNEKGGRVDKVVSVERITPDTYRLVLQSRSPVLDFESVGGLNVWSEKTTFYYDSSASTIVEYWPTDNYELRSTTTTFYFNATDTTPGSAYLYTNETGSWIVEESLGSWTSGANTTISHTFSVNGHINWGLLVTDEFGKETWSANRTLNITYTEPVTNNAFWNSTTETIDAPLLGWCNVSDADGENLTSYQYLVYKDAALQFSGYVNGTFQEGQPYNVFNVGEGNLSKGQNWTLSCRGYDNTTWSSWVNSTPYEFLVLVRLWREKTGLPFNISGASEVTQYVYCPEETQVHTFTTNSENVDVSCDYTLIKLNVEYSTGGSYYRTLIPENNTNLSVIDWYLIDLALNDTALQRVFELADLTGDYADGTIEAWATITNTSTVVIQQPWDIENSATLYLMKDALYTIKLISSDGLSTRVIGTLIPDVAAEQTLRLPEIEFAPDAYMYDQIWWYYDFNATQGYLQLNYQDLSGTTVSTNLTVYEGNLSGPVVYSQRSTSQTVSYTYNGVSPNTTYVSSFIVVNPNINPIDERRTFGAEPLFTSSPGWDPDELETFIFWAAIIFLVVWGLSTTAVHAGIGLTTTTIFMGIFDYWGWVDFPALSFAVAVLAAVFAWVAEGWRK